MKFFTERKNLKYEILAISIILCITWVYFFQWWNSSVFLLVAAILGLYMAMNIWANDIANNMGPAVGSKALTLIWAIALAIVAEASGAIIAWWDVVDTIKWWIIKADLIEDKKVFLSIMIATLIWASLWINLATFFRAPVSATHSVIWALIWAWITAAWFAVVTWGKIW